MTRLVDDPKEFAAQALEGFVAAHPDHVLPVPGGVVRATESPAGQVAVVLGGGSGHYPAFAGWVGQGMAHGAVCGNVFASPSASQVASVVRAAHTGGGVLLGFGNYAGDVLHFGQAAEQLRAEGLDVRVVTVTDDVASAPAEQAHLRRGIAGDLVVFKVAGAAAAEGRGLDAVEALARQANDRTRTLGVAFSGCTLPGAQEPLFALPEGTMALGLGIHGEPGLREAPLGTAREVADLLVDGVLAERPDDASGRVAVLLNGLGTTTAEELFVVHANVTRRLAAAGLTAVGTVVGEQVSSLDMAGLSLTLTHLDDELERLWLAPADTPAFRRGSLAGAPRRRAGVAATAPPPVPPGSSGSRRSAAAVLDLLRVLAATAAAHEGELARLDAVAGDGDHGQGMVLGTSAAVRAAEEVLAADGGAATLLVRAGAAWAEAAGGTSGALWGAALTAAGGALSDASAAGPVDVAEAVRRGADAVVRLGGARMGDKTMVDALLPFAAAFADAHGRGADLVTVATEAADAAREGAEETARMAARLGRARTHGDASLGRPDPGATSFALLAEAAARAVGRAEGRVGSTTGGQG